MEGSHGVVLTDVHPEFKLAAIEQLETGVSVADVARAFEVHPSLLQRWQQEFRQAPATAFPGLEPDRIAQDRPAGAGDQFFEGVLAAHRRAAEAAGIGWKAAVYQQIEGQRDGAQALTMKRMCTLAGISRAGFYRFPSGTPGPDPDLELRDAIQRIALEFPSYGWPRMTAELKRRGWGVNHKRVYRVMREDNLLCLRRRKFVVTTDSGHGLPVYPNLARERTLTDLDQLWVADITYIRLQSSLCIWPRCWTRFPGGRSAGRWTGRWKAR
jgi:transposase-like protein